MALLEYVDPEAVDERTRELLAADADYCIASHRAQLVERGGLDIHPADRSDRP